MGDAIGLIGKGSKLACSIQKGLRVAANMGSLFKSTYVVGNVIKSNIDRYLINGEEFSWSQLGVDLLTIGLEVFAMKNAAKGLVEAENMQVCFVAGTLITTAEGYKAIEEIQAGDEVLAKDVETGEVAVKKVVRTFVNETDELVHVHVNGEEIIATPTHPFYVNQFGWTHAADLRAGDVLVLSNGEYVVVEAIQHEILESPVKVYNFEVEDFHTYLVGESSVLVHNECYSRVQGGGSEERIRVNSDGTIKILDKDKALYVSVGDGHAGYFLSRRGEGAYIVQFDLPDWVSQIIDEIAIPQSNAKNNPLNAYLPKIVDPTKPGLSYQLPPSWLSFIESVATNGRRI